jgi:hypothetical protein
MAEAEGWKWLLKAPRIITFARGVPFAGATTCCTRLSREP